MKQNFVWVMLLLMGLSFGGYAAEADTSKDEPVVVDSTGTEAESKPPVKLAPGTTLTEIRPEKLATVEKILELPGMMTNDGKLKESIGVETLAGIVTPLMMSGQSAPVSALVKLGIHANCDCAKLRLFRIPDEAGIQPVEISYDAIRGFSADHKTVSVELEVTDDSKLHQKVLAPQNLAPGKLLEWMPAKDIKPEVKAINADEKEIKPENKAEIPSKGPEPQAINKNEPNAK